MKPSPAQLKAHLVLGLSWDLPMLESLWHNVHHRKFALEARASEWRRTQWVPLFSDWIPKDCSVELGNGKRLVSLHMPNKVTVVYLLTFVISGQTLACPVVSRLVRYAGPNAQHCSDLQGYPNDWVSSFKDDVVGHYAAERLLKIYNNPQPIDVQIRLPRLDYFPHIRFELGRIRESPSSRTEGREIRIGFMFRGEWDYAFIEIYNHRNEIEEWLDLMLPISNPRGGFTDWTRETSGRKTNNSGLDPFRLHENIVSKVNEAIERVKASEKRQRDRSPTRT